MPEDSGTEQVSTHVIGSSSPSASESSAESGNVSDQGGAQEHSASANAEQKTTNGAHRESRYERTKRERAEFRAQQAAFQRDREAFAKERRDFEESKKPKRDYTLTDLRKYRNQWYQEGEHELVEKADREIAAMESELAAHTVQMPPPGTPEHRALWTAAEQELMRSDSDFLKAGTALDTRLREIMSSQDGDIYRQHPRGIIAAYHRAKMELLEANMGGLQTENSKLKTELQRLTGLTSIDGGALSGIGNGAEKNFERMSTKDMRKHLLNSAKRNSLNMF